MAEAIVSYRGIAHQVSEWAFEATHNYGDPFNDVEVEVLIDNDAGSRWRVPAFWAGGAQWRVRFAPPAPGHYTFVTQGTPSADRGLHDVRGALEVTPYEGGDQPLARGGLRVAADGRHLEHADGTPFFWLGDTWWMGLTRRLGWPEDCQRLTADRLAKGFTVVQIVAGLYPDMDWGDTRGENEAGLPYDRALTRINPAYFEMADLRIRYLVQAGLVLCIVGCWGYFLKWMGVEKMQRHWRYLIARWGAYPVVWCLAGEATMPYYLSETRDEDAALQKAGWTEIGRYVRAIDPMRRLVTIHPTACGRDQVEDDTVLDFEMLQTGHSGHDSIPRTVAAMKAAYNRTPRMPVLNAEVNYEGIKGGCYDDVQRVAFWTCMLQGAAGHTYGANGIWQVNGCEVPYGPSPHGNNWGNRPWEEAMRLPGSTHLGRAKRLLELYPWWQFEPHQEWVAPCGGPDNAHGPYAAGIPGRVRVIYTPRPIWGRQVTVGHLEAGRQYLARFVNPSTAQEFPLGAVAPDADGNWLVPQQPELRDWLLVLEAS
jgi:hypothetical protein